MDLFRCSVTEDDSDSLELDLLLNGGVSLDATHSSRRERCVSNVVRAAGILGGYDKRARVGDTLLERVRIEP